MQKKRKVHSLTGRIDLRLMHQAFKAVKRNRGAAGIDKVSINMFAANLEENLAALMKDLKAGTFRPRPTPKYSGVPPGRQGVLELDRTGPTQGPSPRTGAFLVGQSSERCRHPRSGGAPASPRVVLASRVERDRQVGVTKEVLVKV